MMLGVGFAFPLRFFTFRGVAAEPTAAYLGTWTHQMPLLRRTVVLRCEQGPNDTLSWGFVRQSWSYKPVFTRQVLVGDELEVNFKMVGYDGIASGYTLTYRLKPRGGELAGQLRESWRAAPGAIVLTREAPIAAKPTPSYSASSASQVRAPQQVSPSSISNTTGKNGRHVVATRNYTDWGVSLIRGHRYQAEIYSDHAAVNVNGRIINVPRSVVKSDDSKP